ncbi:hypothetical protein [Parvularcula marina]|uniref:hypothetical protein n=1 Tax=Parvularcula marina TaxID=2292771 RepID=UPI0035118A95
MTGPRTLYVVGGERRPSIGVPEWETGVAGLIYEVTVSPEGETTSREFWRYTIDDAAPYTGTSTPVVFKSSSRIGDRFLLCTVTEILDFDPQTKEILRRVTHPWFNDVHHVSASADDTLLVVITGLDMAVRMNWDGEIMEEWSALPESSPWEYFEKGTDYRQVPTTKPHKSHPNYICEVEGELWLTRFHQRDAINLGDPSRRMAIPVGNPHDGEIGPLGRHWFTTTNGQLAIIKRSLPEAPEIYDLNAIIGAGRPLGWCRGLYFISATEIVVGFSRLRRTRIEENVRWVKDQVKQGLGLAGPADLTPLPTRIACIDLTKGEQRWTVDFSGTPLSEIFSIL